MDPTIVLFHPSAREMTGIVYPTWVTIEMVTHNRNDEWDDLPNRGETLCDAPKRGTRYLHQSDVVQPMTTDTFQPEILLAPPPPQHAAVYFNVLRKEKPWYSICSMLRYEHDSTIRGDAEINWFTVYTPHIIEQIESSEQIKTCNTTINGETVTM